MVVAADNVGAAHIMVIDHHCQHIGRRAVGAQQDVVVDLGICDAHFALHGVLNDGVAFGRCFQSYGKGRLGRCFARIAVAPAAIIPHRLFGFPLGGAHIFQLFLSGKAFVGVAGFQQCKRHFSVTGSALGLENRLIVVIKAKPVEPFDDFFDCVLRRPFCVGIFNSQQSLTAMMAGEQPVEQRCPRAAKMEVACGRRSETSDHSVNSRSAVLGAFACHLARLPFLVPT